MTKLLATSALAILLVAGAAADANAWTRNGTWTGPHGTGTWGGSGQCASNGAGGVNCAGSGKVTGPAGNYAVRQGTATCANGACAYNGVITGSGGRSYTYSGSVTRN